MIRILKFPLRPGVTEFETADEPRFLAVGVQQGDQVVVWVEAVVGTGVVSRVATVMTGEEPPPDSEYVGTAQLQSVPIVVHAYRQIGGGPAR